MLAPHELKNKTFNRAVRGYNPIEVDQYFDFLIEKYTEAYKLVSELEQKYNKLEAKYSELSNEEKTIRSAILKAQKLSEAIVNNAKSEANEIHDEMVKRCDSIIDDAKKEVEEEKNRIVLLRKFAIDFQHKLYNDYVKHVETLQSLHIDEMIDFDAIFNKEDDFTLAKKEVLDSASDPLGPKTTDSSDTVNNQ